MQTPLLLDYQTEHGTSKIRSFYLDENLFISLEDVVFTLAKSNTALNTTNRTGLGALIKAQAEVLDPDECREFPVNINEGTSARQEIFITEPGLYRLISRDNTPASKLFQRWIFHEVLPAIRKHGTYPAPSKNSNSEIMLLAQSLAQHTNLLIKEIGEREKLALETKLKFEETSRQLLEINQKIDTISVPDHQRNFIKIADYCTTNNITIDLTHLRAMCAKLCLEQSIDFTKDHNSSIDMDHLYPPSLIAESIRIINHR